MLLLWSLSLVVGVEKAHGAHLFLKGLNDAPRLFSFGLGSRSISDYGLNDDDILYQHQVKLDRSKGDQEGRLSARHGLAKALYILQTLLNRIVHMHWCALFHKISPISKQLNKRSDDSVAVEERKSQIEPEWPTNCGHYTQEIVARKAKSIQKSRWTLFWAILASLTLQLWDRTLILGHYKHTEKIFFGIE